ncbi:hypothetical protein J5N97_000248 [Dioscorea zingiberensis]|uniref:Uncharacterized protein n=1 Tax=Dioscorea zingiberensis TaxID=325984 RepID=A0A9D5BSK0_9LILI|nr:hypothetical protein J5N97_000248 [Dioscorea zingiberensis]
MTELNKKLQDKGHNSHPWRQRHWRSHRASFCIAWCMCGSHRRRSEPKGPGRRRFDRPSLHLHPLRRDKRGSSEEPGRINGPDARPPGHHFQQRRNILLVRADRDGLRPLQLRQAHGGQRPRDGGVCEACGAAMVEGGVKGSVVATTGLEWFTDYTMSKHAILGLVRSASIQLGA